MKKVFLFSEAFKAFNGDDSLMREYLGGKGTGLAQMTNAGLNVPPGLTITTKACVEYMQSKNMFPQGLFDEILEKLSVIEGELGKKLGDKNKPLLVSVRSGARFSMPGMMDTVLNLGLNDETVVGLAKATANERFALDSYRRFIQMFGDIVLGINKESFERVLTDFKSKTKITSDAQLDVSVLKEIIKEFKNIVKEKTKNDFVQDVKIQLKLAIEAVFKSWNNPRAKYYRKLNKIPDESGTAVSVQAMVFGNMGDDSATGVAFTRNPSTGEAELYGEYLICAQGEDVVSGIRTPKKISEMGKELPSVYKQFTECAKKMETYYRDVQDIEFTIESGRLWVLQTRAAKRTAQASVKIAVDFVSDKIISKEEAITRIDPVILNQFLLKSFNPKAKELAQKEGKLLAVGLNASPGAAIGKIVFNPDESEKLSLAGQKVILIRVETCPDDIHGIVSAEGVLTSRGGMTSHAAVVARGMGKPCVVGCEALKIDLEKEIVSSNGYILKKGDLISIDGSTGQVFTGDIETQEPKMSKELKTLLLWADEIKKLGVRANADTPTDAKRALDFGACGIGLCRTEHMFMQQERLVWVQKMIMASTHSEREEALKKLLPFQKQDFKDIFKVMAGLPVTIRLLDPPLHEFLPKRDELIAQVGDLKCKGLDYSKEEKLLNKVRHLHEVNPMMGLRGCRLGISYPEINKMQVEAIFEAACELVQEKIDVKVEIMIPLISEAKELKHVKDQLENTAKEIMEKYKTQIDYKFGTMIEVPRAALTAYEIAEHAEFFSFGTNDLTQMTFAFSRDDAEGNFLPKYIETKILPENPFEVLDTKGVGRLMRIAVEDGRKKRKDLKIGICGEHGGEPKSISFANELGLDYVSCSPFRIPIARLAAAQACLKVKERDK
ncbi:MAG: pyruvate, phosphate dikinase [Candidatus Melainabacteria bacterium]|nr:pyruvate, phosphate dikinase [Candidatus Melainabacteria bacterium]